MNNDIRVNLDITKINLRSTYGGQEVVYTALFIIMFENTKLKGSFDFVRNPISGIAHIETILNIEEQTTENTLLLDKEEIIDILDEYLNNF